MQLTINEHNSSIYRDLTTVYTNDNRFVILLSRVYFSNWVTEIQHSSPLKPNNSVQLRIVHLSKIYFSGRRFQQKSRRWIILLLDQMQLINYHVFKNIFSTQVFSFFSFWSGLQFFIPATIIGSTAEQSGQIDCGQDPGSNHGKGWWTKYTPYCFFLLLVSCMEKFL